MKEVIIICDVCGKPLHDGDRAYGTIGGSIEQCVNGFMPTELDGWFSVVCQVCGNKISKFISNMTA